MRKYKKIKNTIYYYMADYDENHSIINKEFSSNKKEFNKMIDRRIINFFNSSGQRLNIFVYRDYYNTKLKIFDVGEETHIYRYVFINMEYQ